MSSMVLADFVSSLSSTESFPVHVKEIAERFGIKVLFSMSMPQDVSGFIERKVDEQYRIVVNANHNEHRQRFTIAHEISHYILHRDILEKRSIVDRNANHGVMFRSNATTDIQEREANNLAAKILMPTNAIRHAITQGSRTVSALANQFDVSPEAMRIRLENLGWLSPKSIK